jgi:hypothetical protein
VARQLLLNRFVRRFLVWAILAVLGFLYLYQKHNEPPLPAANPVTAQKVEAKATPAPLTPAPRGQASEYNYMKRALDRARDVTEQSRARTQAAQDP